MFLNIIFFEQQFAQEEDSVLSKSQKTDVQTIEKDTITKDTLKISPKKEKLADIVTHTADDYISIDMEKNITTLYNNAKLHYQDVDLEAGVIIIDFKNELIKAHGITDSLGYGQKPHFKQGSEESVQDSLLVNYKTERALIWGLKTEQEGGLYMGSAISKKVNDSTLYVKEISVTSSKKEPRPDYYIDINKAKIIPNKKIIAGWSQLYIADVPTPAIMPFAYFPLTKTRTSGILMPTWGESADKGYFLQNGGYYLAFSDYFDLALTGDLYTNGSWGMNTRSNYALKYKFRGSVDFSYENNINSLRGFDNYSHGVLYNIRWSHHQDASANPNANLSASVNLGSSRYFKESLNEYTTNANLNNILSSSISYSKRFYGTPFNASLSATHSQNTNTQQINMTLPTLMLSMDRIYPFAPKTGSKKNAFHRLSLNYNLNGAVNIQTNDQEFFTRKMFETSLESLKHAISLSTNARILSYFTLSPSANYNELWFLDYKTQKYDSRLNKVVIDTLQGFKSVRDFSVGAGLSTTGYGIFKINKGRLKAIRHTITPNLSYTYKPNFAFQNEQYYDPINNKYVEYSPYFNYAPSSYMSNSIGISIQNNFEAKVMEKDSTKTEPKIIPLLNSLNINTGYNITADSLRWSNVTMTTGIDILKKKMRINANASLDPYAINASGNRIDIFNIQNGGSLFRLTNAGLTMSYNMSNKTFNGDKNANNQNSETKNDAGIEGSDTRNINKDSASNEVKTKKTRLYYADIPWTMDISYTLQYADNGITQSGISSNSLTLRGNIDLTPKWTVGYNTGYDFKRKGITYTTLNFSRDLDSWQMSFNWVPFGYRQTYYFYIGVKSSILSDLKYDKQSPPDKRLY